MEGNLYLDIADCFPAIHSGSLAGTHGFRSDYGNLATLVTKLKIVTGEGKVVSLSSADDDTFKAAQVRMLVSHHSLLRISGLPSFLSMIACLLRLPFVW